MSRILLSQADVTDAEARAVAAATLSGWVAPLGPEVDAFESEMARRTGVAHALALSSGTAALHLALLGVGVTPGSVVVLPTLTFAASANAVAYTGATPVFVDVQADDGNLDPSMLEVAVDTLLREGATVSAVMTVDLLGRVVDHAAIGAVAAARGIPVVADAAESVGATSAGRAAGAFGRVAALSFNGNKIMTTSGGGMLLSDDGDLVARARYLSTQARQPVAWYEHTEVGYNYRLSNVLAALGRVQLGRLDALLARRRAIRERYTAGLADVPGVRVLGPAPGRDDTEDNCWLTSLVLDPDLVRPSADAVIAGLGAADIEARHLWKPLHLQPVHRDDRSFLTGVAETLFARCVTLPSGSALSDDDVDRVLGRTRELLGH